MTQSRNHSTKNQILNKELTIKNGRDTQTLQNFNLEEQDYVLKDLHNRKSCRQVAEELGIG